MTTTIINGIEIEIDDTETTTVNGIEIDDQPTQTAADDYDGDDEEVRSFLSCFEV
jgi:hypothetical protein